MNISSLSINRPVLATVISLIIVLFGAIGYSFLGIREFPSVDPPVVTVTTNYIGANADVIESQITEPLEESINGIAGIRSLTSVSSDGRSNITVEFELNVDMETAANDVRDRVSRAIRNIPPDTDPPIVNKSDADANPIFALTLQSNSRDLMELSDIANNVFKERLQTIPGVSEIRIWGERRYSMKLLLDPSKMASFRLTPGDVRNALYRENIELPTGRIEGYGTELTIRTKGRLTSPAEFNDMILMEKDGTVIRMRDVGIAKLLPENERTIMKGNGCIPMVGVGITPQPGSNQIAIVDECYKRVAQLKNEMPADIKVGTSLDSTLSIRKAITEVQETILIAFGLVLLVIFFFLRSWRTTLIPIIAIPISLISGFFIMYAAGFSINILTLLGIVLATGLVVDDAIVVLENIYHKIEAGMDPVEAGHKGSKEIYFAILSTTITLAAVFLPIIFLQGLTGRLFREFGVVVAGTVLVSALVSLTLTPMMSSRMLRKVEHHNAMFIFTENLLDQLTNAYNRSLTFFIRRRWLAIIIIAVSMALILGIGALIPSELAPMEDKSRMQVMSTAPEGTSFELMSKYIDQMTAIIDTIPEKESMMAITAPGFGSSATTNTGFVRISLTQPETRKRTQQQIADELSAIGKKFNFARTFVVQEQTIGGGRNAGLPVQYVILAPDFDKLKKFLPRFMEQVQADPAFQVVDLNLKFNKPELAVEIDRDRAQALGINVRDIAENLQLYFSGQRYGYFIMNSKQYQVIGQADRLNRDKPLDLSSIYIRNNKGDLIQLDNVVKLKEQSNPPQLYRFNRYVSATVSAQPVQGVTLGQGIAEMRKIGKASFDDSFSSALAGTSKEFEDSSGSLLFALLLALVLVYLILSAQFESFIDPLIIMFTVPLALAGAMLSLWIFGQTLNIFSEIGVIVLIGIVTKNGILIVEFANQRKAAGLNLKEAAIDAATRRLRPILMTSLATALGALPIAMALGAASRSRVPMGITIIGGLIFSLILTLYVIPALYTFLSRAKVKSHQRADTGGGMPEKPETNS
ncbi:MAG: efflux RND transporter permease subunit [Bacteroidota bacterium]